MTTQKTATQPQGVFKPLGPQKIVVGVGRLDEIDAEVTELGAERICIITSPSVATQTPLIKQLESSLGDRVKGVFQDVIPHTPIPNLFDAAAKAREVGADCLISIGGGSSIDTGKAVAFVLDHNIREMAPWAVFWWTAAKITRATSTPPSNRHSHDRMCRGIFRHCRYH